MWLLAALLTSIVWKIVSPLQEDMWWAVLWGVALQELLRYVMWRLLKRAETGLNALAPDADGTVHITREKQALVAGLGYGLMSAVMQYSMALDSATGPGTLPARGCGAVSLFVVSALLVSMVSVLHMFWSVIMFRGLEEVWEGRLSGGVFLLSRLTPSFLSLETAPRDPVLRAQQLEDLLCGAVARLCVLPGAATAVVVVVRTHCVCSPICARCRRSTTTTAATASARCSPFSSLCSCSVGLGLCVAAIRLANYDRISHSGHDVGDGWHDRGAVAAVVIAPQASVTSCRKHTIAFRRVQSLLGICLF
jgi:hypothetical protein